MSLARTPDFAAFCAAAYRHHVFDIGDADSAARGIVQDSPVGPVLGIPGTNNIACWLADLDVNRVKSPSFGWVHEGFMNAAVSMFDEVHRIKPAIITGHSEGAALALILAGLLALADCPPVIVYAFEPPQITTEDTLRHLLRIHNIDARLYRHGEDIVPMVPRLLHDWRHPADLIEFGEPALPIWNVEDHDINTVRAALEKRPDL
jgi:hypothetical protein